LGILDEKEIDDLITKLHRANSLSWRKVLKAANVGGERRLTMMLEQLSGPVDNPQDAANIFLTPNQLQNVRTLLERTRAECDEVYCDRCYRDLHNGGKRAFHRYLISLRFYLLFPDKQISI
jgi:hypothetical protein